MTGEETLLAYLWHRLPLLLLFAQAYLVYRLMATAGLTDAFAVRVLCRSRGSLARLLLYVLGTTALMSFFMPNTITVLALLPVLRRIDADLAERTPPVRATTALTLAAIYGANIGGMGSMVGTPANLVLIGALDFFQVPGREHITLFNWFVWSLPLVAAMVLAAWGVVAWLGLSGQERGIRARYTGRPSPLTPWQRAARSMFLAFLGFWSAHAVAAGLWPGFAVYDAAVCVGFFCFFAYVCFRKSGPPCCPTSVPLLTPADLVRDIPRRGLVLIGLLVAVVWTARAAGVDELAAGWVRRVFDIGLGPLPLLLALTLSMIFLTELLSNTAVSVAFLPVAALGARAAGVDPLVALFLVVLAPTCAFMTPIATPANALAFGEMKGTRLGTMLGLGAVLNVAGAAIMTGWLWLVLPLLYG